MDATQKRKVWQVAKAHFVLSVFCGVMFLVLAPFLAISKSHSEPDLIGIVFFVFLAVFFFLLQPQFFLIPVLIALSHLGDSFWGSVCFFVLPLIMAPFWSYAFAWFFVQVKDWLNHFPILGKKII